MEGSGRHPGQLIHAYFGVNLEVVWLSVKKGIPESKPVIENLLNELPP